MLTFNYYGRWEIEGLDRKDFITCVLILTNGIFSILLSLDLIQYRFTLVNFLLFLIIFNFVFLNLSCCHIHSECYLFCYISSLQSVVFFTLLANDI